MTNPDHVPEDAPEHCPGTQSEAAGKSDACAGCPNQKICASGPAPPDPDIALINERMVGVKHKILVLSGKGGVGKSTITTMLSYGLALDETKQVGVMDVDLCGPSIPRMFGVEAETVHQSNYGWSPVYARDNLGVMSIGFMLGNKDDAVIWRGPKKNGLIKQFLRDVNWDELDFLVVDTPPGTSDEHLSVIQFLKESGIDGAVIVTTPQEVSLQDVRKEINFCRKVGLHIFGVVENMAGFKCPNCACESMIFPNETSGGALRMCHDMGVPLLASIPLDVRVGRSCDQGKCFFDVYPNAQDSTFVSYQTMISKILDDINKESIAEQ